MSMRTAPDSTVQKTFAKAPSVHIERSTFNRSYRTLTTFNEDQLTPIYCDEVLPGDTINLQMRHFARLATPLRPTMDDMELLFDFFFVPCRLVWSNWEAFISQSSLTASYTIPQVTAPASGGGGYAAGWAVGSMGDHLGVPVYAGTKTFNALPFRCANLIYDRWYRDQDLMAAPVLNTGNGPDAPANYPMLTRAKTHDYFTTCRPWPQKNADVLIPLGSTQLPVSLSATTNVKQLLRRDDTHALFPSASLGSNATTAQLDHTGTGQTLVLDPNGTLVVDFTGGAGPSVNQWRTAMQLQVLYELDARSGTRYVELLLGHFRVVSPDFRLQNPEYLGGGKAPLSMSPVAQTAPTSGTNYMGNLAAVATSAHVQSGIGFVKSFVEHGYVIGFVTARARLTYQQGCNRMWTRNTRFDFFWPKLQGIGEQSVLTQEIYCDGSATDTTVFGYQERYGEYRYKPSEVHGYMRSVGPGMDPTFPTLDIWHYAQDFGAAPALNEAFVQSASPVSRTVNASFITPHFIGEFSPLIKHARPMVAMPTPVGLGRF